MSRSSALTAALATIVLGACTSTSSTPVAETAEDQSSADSRRSGDPAIRDLTRPGLAARYEGTVPPQATTKAFVPWDSTAILEVSRDGNVGSGALIVRYGKTWQMKDDVASMIYVLEAAGPEIEPIAIQWQPANGAELRAIARVDGELRRYDFDR